MAEPIGALRAELSAGHAAFASDMKKARNAVKTNAKGMSAAMDKVSKKFTQAATALNRFGGMAVIAVAGALTLFVKKQIEIAERFEKLSQQAGVSTEFLSEMSLVASQAGVELEGTLIKSVRKLTQNMDDFRKGTGEAKDTIRDLGIEVMNEKGVLRDVENVLMDVADKFKSMQDGADKTAAAVRLFGRAGTEMIPMLNMGSEGIEKLRTKAQEMGLTISLETAGQAAMLIDQIDILKKSTEGAGREIALGLLPWLNETVEAMTLAKNEAGGFAAAMVLLGGVADALFSKSLDQKIKERKKFLKAIEEGGKSWIDLDGKDHEKNLKRIKADIAELEAQKAKIENAEKARAEAALKKLREEREERRKNTEQIREQSRIKIEAAAAEKKSEAEAAAAKKKEAAELDDFLAREEEATSAIDDQIIALQDQLDTYNISAKEISLHTLAMQGATKEQLASAAAIWDGIEALEKQGETIDEVAAKSEDKWAEMTDAIEGWGQDSADAITDFAMSGETSFSNMIDAMIADLMRMTIQQELTGPLFKGLSSGISDLFNPVAGGASNQIMGPPVSLSAKGNAFSMGNVIPFANGGIVNRPTLFPMAQGAGLMGEAGDEAILPLKRGKGGNLGVAFSGGGWMVVNIYNSTSDKVETKETMTADGSPSLAIMIDQAVAKKLSTFGSSSNKAVRQTFGARPQLTGR